MISEKKLRLIRKRPVGSPLVAAGSNAAKKDLLALTSLLGIELDFVEIDDSGRVKKPYDRSRAGDVEMLWCHGRFQGSWVASAVNELGSLDWVHSDFVGIDALPVETLVARGIVITNGGDNFARPMAEWVMLGILASAKYFPKFVRNSDIGKWDSSMQLSELSGARILLLGLGSVNSLVAMMCKPFRLEVVAWTRRKRSELAEGVSRQITGESWRSELAEADYVVVGLPLTPATEKLLDAESLAIAKTGTTIINLSRGAIIDQDALITSLDSGRVRYVLLDAFEVEPLPTESPLWRRDNVTVLPHHSWSSPKINQNSVERIRVELERWVSGLPLLHTVDLKAGY